MKKEEKPTEQRNSKKRLYNVFFNTHTVSGIVISVGLYVIFLAGAFALFKMDINNWEINEPEKHFTIQINYDRLLDEIAKEGHQMYGRDINVRTYENNGKIYVYSNPPANKISTDSLNTLSREDSIQYVHATGRVNYVLNPETYALTTPDGSKGPEQRIGRLLTRLHYFHQIPVIGLWLAGFVSIIFLFAIITGVIVHWKKIIANFFTFRLKASIKNLWTDAHTALGILGLPFQLMYAVTGTFFGLSIILVPVAMLVFGDVNKTTEILLPERKTYELLGKSGDQEPVTPLVEEAFADIPEEDITRFHVMIKSLGDENAHLTTVAHTHTNEDFSGKATATYKLKDGSLVSKESHEDSSFRTASIVYFLQLHFGNFGGYFLKSIYFLLAVITCFVIISGVMVWLTAREKKAYAHKAKFNRNVGAIYLGACLGLYPAIALLFIMAKILPLGMEGRFDLINYVFFGFWLAYTIYALFIKNYFVINKHALVLAGVSGLAIPFINGIITGLWFWKSLNMGYVDSFFVDVAWLCLSLITFTVAFKAKPIVKRKVIEQDTSALPEEIPVQKKNKAVLPGIKEKAPVLGIKPTQA